MFLTADFNILRQLADTHEFPRSRCTGLVLAEEMFPPSGSAAPPVRGAPR